MDPVYAVRPVSGGTRRWVFLFVLLLLGVEPALSQTPVTLYQSFVGRVNYQATGGSLRTASNSSPCSIGSSSSNPLTGIPAGATVQAAYLYWAGSGRYSFVTMYMYSS